MDIVSLLNPHARARRNALRSLRGMQVRRENAAEADRAVSAATRRREDGTTGA